MPIDRRAVVQRHDPVLTTPDARTPLSVGNGELTYTADVTGFQTFDGYDPAAPGTVPLCTMTQWGFHSYPSAESRDQRYRRLHRVNYDAGDRTVGYMSSADGQEDLFSDLRESPHRANLVAVTLVDRAAPGGPPRRLTPDRCSAFRQRLDLWRGAIESSFTYGEWPVRTEVVCHPQCNTLAFTVDVPTHTGAGLEVELAFPYPSPAIHGSDWSADWSADGQGRHETRSAETNVPGVYALYRIADDLQFTCLVRLEPQCRLRRTGPHACRISSRSGMVTFSIEFIPGLLQGSEVAACGGAASIDGAAASIDGAAAGATTVGVTTAAAAVPDQDRCRRDAADHWEAFWTTGAFLDFGGSTAPQAGELERRIVLSRYLTAIQCSGSMPPAETGLTCNSWYGKFHLEMHPWHALHFPLWGQPKMLARSLDYYLGIADRARERAATQGYRGLRWPKMTDPQGYDSPSAIGTLLCWQQPHFIFLVELLYRVAEASGRGPVPEDVLPTSASPPPDTLLRRYSSLVFDSADFMADYARPDPGNDRFHLGPPLIPAQENHAPEDTTDPVFELEYWRLGLDIAADWKRRLHEPVPAAWEAVRKHLAPPPIDAATGGYAAHAGCRDTYGRFAQDHPAFLIAGSYFLGARIDPSVLSRSLDLVLKHWDFGSTWGWDFPVMAMCAARLGRPEDALACLLMEADKNRYGANGHNPQSPKGDLPLYLPGNGALLTAVALMVGGWRGSVGPAPGFPSDGSWSIRSENFIPLPF